MAFSTGIKLFVNRCLSSANLRLGTLTAEKRELERLCKLGEKGQFSKPIFPVPEAFKSMDASPIFEGLEQYKDRLEDLSDPAKNDVNYTYDNIYYRPPDAEVLYTIIRKFKPESILEVGSGNSTKLSRQAIIDEKLKTQLISIDPWPRIEIDQLADQVIREKVETVPEKQIISQLDEGDILFIDSSHEILTGNDVVFLFLNIIPKLPPGVLIHIHDIFLPYEYPKDWVLKRRYPWGEQYLVQALLEFGNTFSVLWAGHYLQRQNPENFSKCFRHLKKDHFAQNLWLRKKI